MITTTQIPQPLPRGQHDDLITDAQPRFRARRDLDFAPMGVQHGNHPLLGIQLTTGHIHQAGESLHREAGQEEVPFPHRHRLRDIGLQRGSEEGWICQGRRAVDGVESKADP